MLAGLREASAGVVVDERFPEKTIAGLASRGYTVDTATESFLLSYFGRPNAISIASNGSRRGGVEPYRLGTALGY